MEEVEIIDGTQSHIAEAAQIWAEATAARDGLPQTGQIDTSWRMIHELIGGSARSLLLVAIAADGTCVGFVAVAPVSVEEPDLADVHYVGALPALWAGGIGRQLMQELPERLRSAGYLGAQLVVYVDNVRAVQLFEHLGWQPRKRRPSCGDGPVRAALPAVVVSSADTRRSR